MKVCPVCEGRYDETSRFCRRDGAELVPDRAVAPEVLAKRELLERRIALEPESPSLLEELGDLLASIPLHEDALVQFFKALELEPSRESVRRKIADLYRARADWAGAAKHLEALVEAHPADLELLGALAEVQDKSGRKDAAAWLLGRMAALAPGDAAVWTRWRDLLLELRRDEELAAVHRRLTEIEPDALRHWVDLAARFAAQGQERAEEWARIEQRLARAVQDEEVGPGVRGARARLYLLAARLRLGAAGPEARSLVRDVDPRVFGAAEAALAAACLCDLGDQALGRGQSEDAFDTFSLALGFVAQHPRARAALAKIYGQRATALLGQKRFRQAIEECGRGLDLAPGEADLEATRRGAVSGHRRRVALLGGGGVVLGAVVLGWLLLARGGGPFGERPTGQGLVKSFGRQLEGLEGIRGFRSGAGGKEFTFRLGEDRWRVVVEGVAVAPLNDDTGAYRGTLESRWEKNGVVVVSKRGLPPEIQRLLRVGEARYNRYRKRWRW